MSSNFTSANRKSWLFTISKISCQPLHTSCQSVVARQVEHRHKLVKALESISLSVVAIPALNENSSCLGLRSQLQFHCLRRFEISRARVCSIIRNGHGLLIRLKLPLSSRSFLPTLIPVAAANVEVGVFAEALGHSVGIFAFDSSEDFVEVIDFPLKVLCIG